MRSFPEHHDFAEAARRTSDAYRTLSACGEDVLREVHRLAIEEQDYTFSVFEIGISNIPRDLASDSTISR
jgi:hypothetical protein